MGSKLSQYDYSILTLKCVNLIQEKTSSIVILSSCQNRFGIVKTRQYKINKYIYLLKVLTRFSFDFDKMTR